MCRKRTLKKALGVLPPRASIMFGWKLCAYTKQAYQGVTVSFSTHVHI